VCAAERLVATSTSNSSPLQEFYCMPMVEDLPSSPEPAVAVIPVVLRERDQWVVWRYEKRAGRRTKIPYVPRTGGNASAADPGTWTAFDVAWETFQQTRRYDGLAYVFSADDPFCGFDLDDCLDEEGQLLWGADLLEQLDSYCEISPSGQGLKLIVRGKKPAYARCKAAWNGGGTIEIYDQRRLFARSPAGHGNHTDDQNGRVPDRRRIAHTAARHADHPHLQGPIDSGPGAGERL
jgi:putative DNA primase/helicase